MIPLKPVDAAIEQLLAASEKIAKPRVETVALLEARGRVLSEDLVSSINVPQANNSAMDGYAFCLADCMIDTGFEVSQRIPAGAVGTVLKSGTIARIFTGAFIPDGADTVVMQENTEVLADGRVLIKKLPSLAQNVREAGQDIKRGSVILSAGRRIKSQDVGLIASIGLASINVYCRLKVALLSTGDELVRPGQSLGAGQIYNSNHFTLLSMLESLDMEAIDLGIVADTPEATKLALLAAAEAADCIITTGGVSVGEEDHVKGVVESIGHLDLWRIAIKPGKPLAFGAVADTPFFGLPGNPVSSFVTFLIFARPYLLKLQGNSEHALTTVYGNANFTAEGGSRREYYRVQLNIDASGACVVENFTNQGSGVLSSASWANGLAEIEIDQTVGLGDQVKVHLLP